MNAMSARAEEKTRRAEAASSRTEGTNVMDLRLLRNDDNNDDAAEASSTPIVGSKCVLVTGYRVSAV